MTELKIYDNEEFGQIRTITIDGEPWFVGKDVAVALGYTNPQKAICDHVEDDDKMMGKQNVTPSVIDSMGRTQYPTWINESGLYSLIFGSKLESAKRFKRWVMSEVLPSFAKDVAKNGDNYRGSMNTTGQCENSYKSGSFQYIDSREVAEMVEKNHKDLLRDIRRYCKQMEEINQRNIALSDFFMKSTYVDGKGETRACYLITKKGCEFIAHKMTGIKGTKFTATYINRFHEMEDALASQTIPVLQQFMEQQQKFNQQQEDFNQIMLEKINSLQILQGRNIEEDSISVCVEEESESERRRRMLNQLVGKMAKACGWNRNFALHRLYKGLENVLDIALDDYVKIHQAELGYIYVSTLDVVISYDRLYETAVRLCTNTINGMKC